MTEHSLLIAQNAVPPDPTALSSHVPPHSPAAFTNGHITEEGDGEDYTIKCICSFTDDDGSTVMCEKCDTWQHVACYYQDGNAPGEDDSHYCVDCQPRNLDARAADDIQRRLRGSTPEETQRKPKKPGPKPRKKPKNDPLTQAQVNGNTNGHGSPRNGTDGFAKRPKARHQSSNSTTNIPLKLPGHSRRSASTSHAQASPMKSPNSPSISCDPNEAFSPEFMHLYERDTGSIHASANEYNDISLTMTLGDWVRDEEMLAQVVSGKTRKDIFQRTQDPVTSDPFPLQIHTKVDKNIVAHGKHPKWKFITIEQYVQKGEFVGQLHGKIGSMSQYTEDPANRWDHLRHPVPFVFFHPQLPLAIDTRDEGSIFRHLRRSCNANLMMNTVVEQEFDYHFIFSTTRDIEKGEELTIPWTLDEHTRRFFTHQDKREVDEDYIANYCRNVMAEFGGCACNEATCPMEQWAGWHDPPRHKTKGRKKIPRGVSSRSGSEALKQFDDDLDDGTAASTSSHSKPHSRDITPSSTIDSKNILGEPISEREKRKIAALERSEQDRVPEKKKQKRKSADNRQYSHNAPPTPGFAKRGSYHDLHGRGPGSPANDNGYRSAPRGTPSPLQETTSSVSPYVHKECQTETDGSTDLSGSRANSVNAASPVVRRVIKRQHALHRNLFRNSVLMVDDSSDLTISPIAPEKQPDPAASNVAQSASEPVEVSETQVEAITETPGKDDVAMVDAPADAADPSEDAIVAAKDPDPTPAATTSSEDKDVEMKDHTEPNQIEDETKPRPSEDQDKNGSKTSELRIEEMPPPAPVEKPGKSVGTPTIVESPAPISEPAIKTLAVTVAPPQESKSPEAKKKKLSLKEWSRRSSSVAPKADNGDTASQEGGSDLKSGLTPLAEEGEKPNEDAVLETPANEVADPIAQ